ncbi:unnamed protein product, partial [Pleuronectes platessa]
TLLTLPHIWIRGNERPPSWHGETPTHSDQCRVTKHALSRATANVVAILRVVRKGLRLAFTATEWRALVLEHMEQQPALLCATWAVQHTRHLDTNPRKRSDDGEADEERKT